MSLTEFCTGRAEHEKPCVKPKGHGGLCASENFWCVKHDITRLYAGRPCVDCLTDELKRHEQAVAHIGKAEAKSEVVDRFPLRVVRAGFVRLTDEIGGTHWMRADHIVKISTRPSDGTYIETALGIRFAMTEGANAVLDRIENAKANPLDDAG